MELNLDLSERQRLKRVIDWESGFVTKTNRYYFPVQLSLEQDSREQFSTGSKLFPYQTLLQVELIGEIFHYTLLTFIHKGSVKGSFTGTLLFEDYFIGNVQYANYKENRQIKTLRMSGGTNCEWVVGYYVCTEDSQSDSGWSCSPRYEYICEGNGPPIDEETVVPDEPDNGGGNSGNPENPTYDCNGVLNGSAYMSECGCIGGNTGIDDCDPLEVTFCNDVSPADIEAIEAHIRNITAQHCAIKSFVQEIENINGFTLQICIEDSPHINNALYTTDGKITFRTDFIQQLTEFLCNMSYSMPIRIK